MTMLRRRGALWVAGVAAAAATVVAFALWPSGHAAARMTGVKDSGLGGTGSPGTTGIRSADRSEAVPMPCGYGEQSWGYAGEVRAGEMTAAMQGLGAALLTEVRDSATGQVMALIGLPVDTAHFARYFTAWRPVYPQAKEPRLVSCNYLLADKPADQPLMNAAMAAVVRAGYFRSVASVRSKLLIVTVSDNPFSEYSVIVTLFFNGPAYNPVSPKHVKMGPHPVFHRMISYTVLEREPDAQVTGVARGGFQ
jgi:hypothetical protein